MKLTCLIVEDEPMARRLLEQYVGKVASLDLLQSLGSPLAALEFLKEQTPDVLFLDVQMPEITGIALLKILKRKPYVVLTTAYSEYAIEGYELDVTDYLLKPITFERFLKTVEKITQLAQQRLGPGPSDGTTIPPSGGRGGSPADAPGNDETPDFLFVKDGTKSVRVNFDDVQYIEGLKDYVRIHTPARKVTTLQSLKKLAEMLPTDRFIRIHHSYIVAVKWLDEVHRDEVKIGDELLPISNTYRKEFRQFIEDRHLK